MPATVGDPAELLDVDVEQLTGPLPDIPDRDATAIPLSDGRVLLVGFTGRADGSRPPAAVLYDPATEAFHRSEQPDRDGYGQTATLLADGRVLIAGGGGNGGRTRAFHAAELFE